MSRRKDRYAALDREVMPWGRFAGKRISRVPVDYCKKALQDPAQLNPYLRELLLLRIEQDKNWLKDLKSDLRHYRELSNQLERELSDARAALQSIHDQEKRELRSMLEPTLRRLRRIFASKYHPDTAEGSAEMMAMVNRIFNELEKGVKLGPSPDTE